MSISDVIKKSFLEGFSSDLDIIKIFVVLAFSTLCGLYVFIIYRYKTKSFLYNKDFNNSLILLPSITAAIVMAIQTNIVVSLGMVGALSIVRFRNAVKSTMDLLFLFWAISLGITIGANLFEIAIVLCCIVSFIMILIDFVPLKKAPYILVLNIEEFSGTEFVENIIKKHTKGYKIKSLDISSNKAELLIEITLNDFNNLLLELKDNKNITSINLLQHDGSVRY